MTSGDAMRKAVTDAVSAGMNAGIAATQTARARAEELLERSRTGTEQLAAMVRGEIAAQLASMGLATKADLANLEARLRAERAETGPPPAARKAPPRKARAAKAPAAPPPGSAARKGPRRGPPAGSQT